MTRRKQLRGVQIRLVQPSVAPPSWCWRADWLIGGESAYSLLGVFQLLNAVGNNRIASEFAPSSNSERSDPPRAPTLDLNNPSCLNLSKLSGQLELPHPIVEHAFVSARFPRSGWRGSAMLRWCPSCLKSAYHALHFQLPIVHQCAGHGDELVEQCPSCGSALPYKLNAAVSAAPLFCCPACKHDLLASIRKRLVRKEMSDQIRVAITAEASVLAMCDQLPTRTGGVLTAPDSRGYRELVLSGPRRYRAAVDFSIFTGKVLNSLANGSAVSVPSASFAESRASPSRMPPPRDSGCGWPAHIISSKDERLKMAAALYRAVRRRVLRHAACGHGKCIRTACEKLWWPVLGSTTPCFCPHAIAAIRWRMYWEGVSVPTALLQEPTSVPLGLVTWLAVQAPVGSASWSKAVENWLNCHVLGRDLLSSFEHLLKSARESVAQGTVRWSRVLPQELPRTGWICAGRGVFTSPARLYCMTPQHALGPDGQMDTAEEIEAGHVSWHHAALNGVEH